ncbi:MAG TPA: hypothetical protein VFC93_13820 [Chloroflexota bacterium]|nr:hypothetical protein [Chloroflexota bacterium]
MFGSEGDAAVSGRSRRRIRAVQAVVRRTHARQDTGSVLTDSALTDRSPFLLRDDVTGPTF